jgi:hypothetical protein
LAISEFVPSWRTWWYLKLFGLLSLDLIGPWFGGRADVIHWFHSAVQARYKVNYTMLLEAIRSSDFLDCVW